MSRTAELSGQGSSPGGLVELVAGATMRQPLRCWGWGESIAAEAMLMAGDDAGLYVAGLLDDWVAEPRPLRDDPLAHTAPGVPLLLHYERTKSAAALARALELASVLDHQPCGRHGARLHGNLKPEWDDWVWVDCMHTDGPFLARLARIAGRTDLMDLAAILLLTHARVLQDDRSGLFSHGFDDRVGRANGVHWGRGQGWALFGLVDVAAQLPSEHRDRAEVCERLAALAEALERMEATSGGWRTVVDQPGTYVEASVGAFVAAGLQRAVRGGLVRRTLEPLAARAWRATASMIDEAGELTGVSASTPVGRDADAYNRLPTGVYPWGQGPALLAAIEWVRPP